MHNLHWVEKSEMCSILTIRHRTNTYFFSVIYKIGRKSFNFLKSGCMTVISFQLQLRTPSWTTDRPLLKALLSYISYKYSVKPFFRQDRFGKNCSGWISEHLRNVVASQSACAVRAWAIVALLIWEPHPPHPSKEIDTPDDNFHHFFFATIVIMVIMTTLDVCHIYDTLRRFSLLNGAFQLWKCSANHCGSRGVRSLG